MPTPHRDRALDTDDLVERCAEDGRGTDTTGLGLEVEAFVLATDPIRRIPVEGADSLLTTLGGSDGVWSPAPSASPLTADGWRSAAPGSPRISFEPGGQLEVSTSYATDPHRAFDDVSVQLAGLADVLGERGWHLVPVGNDRWRPGTVPQQLSGPRYPAMDASFARRSPAGRTMMRDTCALQLNLDLGTGAEAEARWLVTNLLAPVAVAAFACSPGDARDGDYRSTRQRTWQQLDPTRTGCVLPAADATATISEQWRRFALNAEVLFVTDDDGSHAVDPGWRFGDWMREGHPRFGWPTREDLARHLTTLFPEVRPRGYLEVRSIDAVPVRWREAITALYLGAVYDVRARDRILDVLTGRPRSLSEQLASAAERGVADAAWCATAVEVWAYALEGAWRLTPTLLDAAACRDAESLLDAYTVRGRCPGDELALRHRRDGARAALRWAAEPTTTHRPVPQEACR